MVAAASLRTVSLCVGSASLAAVFGCRWFRRHCLERHGVATTLRKYVRLRFRLRGGWPSLLTLADFDRTISTAACGTSCHGVVESCKELSPAYRAGTKALFDKYFPIETSATMSREEKIPLMQDWYRQAHTLLLKEPFTPALLDSASRESKVALRPGFEELYDLCRAHGSPLVVCSAGLGDVVRALLAHRLSSPTAAAAAVSDLPIVSNWLTFDAADRVNGFSQPLLHMFNKDGAFVRSQLGEARWAALASGRSVCLLLGDGLGDASMADGLGLPNVVKIGLLNETDPERVAARLPQYEAAFDAVIMGDRSFEWLLNIARGLPVPKV